MERSFATLQLFIDTVPAYISFVDAEERYRLVNKRYEEYFGRPAEQVVGQRLCDVQPPAAYAEMQPHLRAVLGGQTVRYQSNPTGPDGRSYWLDVQYVPRRGEGGAVTGFFVLVFDITENKKAEEALRRSEAHFRTLADNLPDVVARFDRNRRHLYINPAAESATGLKPEVFIGRTNEELGMPQENTAIWKASLERVFATGAGERFEFSYPGPDGKNYWESHVVAERGADGGVESALVLSRNITKLRQAELAQQEVLNRLQKIAGQVPGVVYQFQLRADGSSCFPFASEAICQIYRASPEDVREDASRVFSILHPEDFDGIVASIQESARKLTPWRHEYRVKFDDGTVRWLFGNSLPQREPDGSTLWHGFITDITDRKQAEIEREQLNRKMQETQKLESLGVLAGGIAHDFNNLLTSILGNASIAALDLPPGSPVHECIEQITQASMRAADLCKQMLAYSGRGRFVVQKLDLGQLVEQTAQMLQISISKKAALRFRLEKRLPPVEVDATQIRQVIMNLVINASEAIGDRDGVISLATGLTRVDRSYLRDTLMDPELPEGDYVYLEVSDTGCGMSADTRARIFDPFFTTKFTGRGLGLAAVLGIVRGHRGAMKVYSEVGRGTTFKLLFPAASGPGEASARQSASPAEWRGQGTVLVVDDEQTMRNTVERMMRLLGLEPVLASDGREAVEIFRADPQRFTLVLLDLTMPHMDGEQTFAELRRLRPEVRVVLMSGFNAQEALVRFNGKGLASFLQKPFTVHALRTTLQEVLEEKAASP
jgi:PAS domain S-box-containing protein